MFKQVVAMYSSLTKIDFFCSKSKRIQNPFFYYVFTCFTSLLFHFKQKLMNCFGTSCLQYSSPQLPWQQIPWNQITFFLLLKKVWWPLYWYHYTLSRMGIIYIWVWPLWKLDNLFTVQVLWVHVHESWL